jgi:alpha-tubulin suppressor-like RCC1 family protein
MYLAALVILALAGSVPLQAQASTSRARESLRFVQLTAGNRFTCGLTAEGTAYCWGTNDTGQLGIGASPDECPSYPGTLPCALRPQPVAGDLSFRSLEADRTHVCGRTRDGATYCWGMDRYRRSQPTPVRGEGDHRFARDYDPSGEPTSAPEAAAFTQFSRGSDHTCGLTALGRAYCWGDNSSGQVGTGRVPEPHEKIKTPTPVAGGLRFREIQAGFMTTCGTTTEGALYCWGDRAGVKATAECFHVDAYAPCTPRPVRVTQHRFRSVAVGTDHFCGITPAGVGYCWGENYQGSFGTGPADTSHETPVRVTWKAPPR